MSNNSDPVTLFFNKLETWLDQRYNPTGPDSAVAVSRARVAAENAMRDLVNEITGADPDDDDDDDDGDDDKSDSPDELRRKVKRLKGE